MRRPVTDCSCENVEKIGVKRRKVREMSIALQVCVDDTDAVLLAKNILRALVYTPSTIGYKLKD
ncbi:MAG: hypothetical protein ACUVWK_05700 [Nitrososphaerales archaeon]